MLVFMLFCFIEFFVIEEYLRRFSVLFVVSLGGRV